MTLLKKGLHFYLFGLIILTLGIALSVLSLLGTSPFDALLVGLFRTFGLTIGSWEIVVGTSMVIGNALLDKKRPEYFALITSFITGIGIDSWLFILEYIYIPHGLGGQIIYLLLGILLTGIGVAFYLQSEIAPNPMDRSMMILSNKLNWSVTKSRAFINVLLVIVAFLFGGAIGIGTLINALVVGWIISLLLPWANKLRNASLHNTSLKRKEVQ